MREIRGIFQLCHVDMTMAKHATATQWQPRVPSSEKRQQQKKHSQNNINDMIRAKSAVFCPETVNIVHYAQSD